MELTTLSNPEQPHVYFYYNTTGVMLKAFKSALMGFESVSYQKYKGNAQAANTDIVV